MLYEGAIRFLQQAMEAIRNEDHELRYAKLTHAGEIIVALKKALDIINGGPEARMLDQFYQSIDNRILALHRYHSLAECSAIIEDLRRLRDMWDAIDRGEVR